MATGFLGLQEVSVANASNLFECLDFHITQDSLSYDKLIGWNSDGASVMLGKHNSVVSRLKAKQPNYMLFTVFSMYRISWLVMPSVACLHMWQI